MKRMFLTLGSCLCMLAGTVSAQTSAQAKSTKAESLNFPLKSPRLSLLAEGHFNATDYPGRYGVGGAAKLMFTAQRNKDVFNEYVITFRATHSAPTNGGFFKGFDGGNYDNISALVLTGGYRFNFGVPRYMIHGFSDDVGGWFIEVNVGAAYIHKDRTLGPAIAPAVGYAIARKLDLVGTFIGEWALKHSSNKEAYPAPKFTRNTNLLISSIGLQYNF